MIGPSEPTNDLGLTEAEQARVSQIAKSRQWRLIRDYLCREREVVYTRPPSTDNDREIWMQRGELSIINRLLRLGPTLAVYYERDLRDGKRQPPVDDPTVARPGESPDDLGSL